MQTFTISTTINKPLSEVFAAVYFRNQLTKYFAERASSDLIEGEKVIWNWGDFGDHPVQVRNVVDDVSITFTLSSLDWQKSDGEDYEVTVDMEFESLSDGQTRIKVSESGWIDTADGVRGSYDNCEGWTHMTMCLKAYLEYGIDLR